MYATDTMTRPKSNPLPSLDLHQIREQAATWVQQRVADAPDDATIVGITSSIVDSEQRRYDRLRRERDLIALSVRAYGPDATGPNPVSLRNVRLAEAAGMSRSRLQALADGYGGAPMPFAPNARERLPKVAHKCATHAARVEIARRLRDETVHRLLGAGWRNTDIARLMGRVAPRASHLRAEKQYLDLIARGLDDVEVARQVAGDPTDAAEVAKLAHRVANVRRKRLVAS